MKRFRINPNLVFLIALFQAIFFLSPAHSAPKEAEYLNAVVTLIDHKTGDFGVLVKNEATGVEEKKAFKADPVEVYVSNPLNQLLDFSELQVGDRVDVYTAMDDAHKETVVDIYASSRFEEQ